MVLLLLRIMIFVGRLTKGFDFSSFIHVTITIIDDPKASVFLLF